MVAISEAIYSIAGPLVLEARALALLSRVDARKGFDMSEAWLTRTSFVQGEMHHANENH